MKCTLISCPAEAAIRVLEVRNKRAAGQEEFLCEEHANARWLAHCADDWAVTGSKYDIAGIAAFDLELITAHEKKRVYTALLREIGGKRLVSLPIGYLEACTLYYAVLDSPYSHLLVHTIMLKVVQSFGGNLASVMVHDVDLEWHFKATLVFLKTLDVSEFQIRPSDGLILANLADTPFLIKESVIAKIKQNPEKTKGTRIIV